MPAPPVTVLMTTYNGAATIEASIGSVLAQTFRDFELLIVDDGSTDDTPAILGRIRDARVRIISRPGNCGIVGARNAGFAAVRGRYVAALDHDDLSDPERLERQVRFLDANPGVVLVATEVRIAQEGKVRAPHHPQACDPVALRWLLLIDNPLTWSSVMFRADAVRRLGAFMRPEYALADDFDLFHRLLRFGDVARLPQVLTTYRYHATNASLARADLLRTNAAKVLEAAYAPLLGADSGPAALLVTRHLSEREPVRDRRTLDRIGNVLERLLDGYCTQQNLSQTDRGRVAALAAEAWWRTVRAAVRSGAPSMILAWPRPAFASAHRPKPADAAVSLGAGLIRAVRR